MFLAEPRQNPVLIRVELVHIRQIAATIVHFTLLLLETVLTHIRD